MPSPQSSETFTRIEVIHEEVEALLDAMITRFSGTTPEQRPDWPHARDHLRDLLAEERALVAAWLDKATTALPEAWNPASRVHATEVHQLLDRAASTPGALLELRDLLSWSFIVVERALGDAAAP